MNVSNTLFFVFTMINNSMVKNLPFVYIKVMSDKPFYNIKEFSELVGAHPNTIYAAIKRGKYNAFRIGEGKKSAYRIPASEIERAAQYNMEEIIEMIIKERGEIK